MAADNLVELEVSTGTLVGHKTKTNKGTEYFSFEGIPYALVPDGDRKFKDPLPQTPWSGKFECKPVNPCPQFDPALKKVIGELDCLQINVFTKRLNKDADVCSGGLPVIFYIHGGAFMRNFSATSIYGPDYFMEKDVVLVTCNYRVGILGFASFEDPSLKIPGNAGLKDQLLALRWVQDNIREFGGDPNNVTAAGGSAGACSVHMHMLSPLSKGLFHKAIIQSGSALNSWATMRSRTLDLARALGWKGKGGDKAALLCLQQTELNILIVAQEKLITPEDNINYDLYPFGPVVEPYVSEQSFIPKKPLDIILQDECWGLDIPLVIGINSEEGLMFKKFIDAMPRALSSPKSFEYVLPKELKVNSSPQICKELADKIKTFYYADKSPTADNINEFINLMTDRFFAHGVVRTIRHHRGPKFVYKFAVDSPTNNLHRIKYCGEGTTGTSHADEVPYMFHTEFSKNYEEGSLERKAINKITDLFVKFAQHQQNSSQWSTDWPEWNKDQQLVLLIANDGAKVIEGFNNERMKLWDEMYKITSCKL